MVDYIISPFSYHSDLFISILSLGYVNFQKKAEKGTRTHTVSAQQNTLPIQHTVSDVEEGDNILFGREG